MTEPHLRELILAAGLASLHQNGYHATGVEDIARVAGVAKGVFYGYFESKEALGAEVVERYGFNGAGPPVLADQSIPPKTRLRLHFAGLNDMFSDKDFMHGCLLGNFSAELGDSSPMIRQRLAAVYEAWTADLASAIGAGQADGSITSRFPSAHLAMFILDAWEGALLRARVAKTRQALDVFLAVGLETALS